ncbi:MAG: hypothetical protein IT270_05055 [Saprospiraceae bacterium]|nr:hypothetical protein [Saprospiraceae bacterium]
MPSLKLNFLALASKPTNQHALKTPKNPPVKSEKETTVQTWSEKKRNYKIGAGVFLFFFLFSFIDTPNKAMSELTALDNVVLRSILYRSSSGKVNYQEIRFHFKGKDNVFIVNGTDYQYFDHEDFRKEVSIGDTLSVMYDKTFFKYKIYAFFKNGRDYCDLQKANLHRDKNDLWIRILAGFGLMVCLITLSFKKEPLLNMGLILFLGLVLLAYVLSQYL